MVFYLLFIYMFGEKVCGKISGTDTIQSQIPPKILCVEREHQISNQYRHHHWQPCKQPFSYVGGHRASLTPQTKYQPYLNNHARRTDQQKHQP